MAAEGGTSINHTEVVFSSDSPFGPFKPCAINPILTQRGLPSDRTNPVTCAGHADLVQTPEGDWKAVFLAVRPYKGGHDVMGRETYLLPVEWKDGQPVILPKGEVIVSADREVAPTHLWKSKELADEAIFIRTPQTNFYRVASGNLELKARSVKIKDKGQPSAVGRWITHFEFEAETVMDFTPENSGDVAGLLLFHNDETNVTFGKSLNTEGKPCLTLKAYSKGVEKYSFTHVLAQEEADKELQLKVKGGRNKKTGEVTYQFCYAVAKGKEWKNVGNPVSADWLSTQTAGGFTGTMVGVYATGKY